MPVGSPQNLPALIDKDFLKVKTYPSINLKLYRPCVDGEHILKSSFLLQDVLPLPAKPSIKVKLFRPCFIGVKYSEVRLDEEVRLMVAAVTPINLPFKSFVAKPAYAQTCVQFDGGGTDGCSEDS